MRFTNVICVLAFGGLAAATSGIGCSGGGDTSGSTSGNATTGTGGSDMTGSTSSTGSAGAAACSPTDAACTKVTSECIALADNKGKDTFTLRMSQLTVAKPAALSKGVAKTAIAGALLMNLKQCNLAGQGTFSLLMQFDTKAKKLTVGGATPVMSPLKGYTFAKGMAAGLDISPVITDLNLDATNKFSPAKGVDLNIPIYLSATETTPGIVLPLHQASIAGTLSDNNNCVGKYNADKLDPKKLCAPTDTVPAFTDAASLDAFVTLEQADNLPISAVGQTLCVLLSDDATMYGDMSTPKKCKRDAGGKIVFKGDWCSTTNMAASATCADALKLTATLAASSVLYTP
jgi:hypothetical protein